MKQPQSTYSSHSQPDPIHNSPANPGLDRTLHELILREYFLMCAIEKTSYRKPSLSSMCDEALLSDLQENQHYLHALSEGVLVPAIAALTSAAGRKWELDLLTILSQAENRWEPVRRLAEELKAIDNLLQKVIASFPEENTPLAEHRQRISAHFEYQQNILATWVETEMSYGRPVEKLLVKESAEIGERWNEVVAELIGKDSAGETLIPPESWRSLPRIVRLIVQSITSVAKPSEWAA